MTSAGIWENGPSVAGAAFPIANIYGGLAVRRWFRIEGLDRPSFAALAAYCDLLGERLARRERNRNSATLRSGL